MRVVRVTERQCPSSREGGVVGVVRAAETPVSLLTGRRGNHVTWLSKCSFFGRFWTASTHLSLGACRTAVHMIYVRSPNTTLV